MSDVESSDPIDPTARATQNWWYLYVARDDIRWGNQPRVRAVIEEVCGEVMNDGFNPKHTLRRVFLLAADIRDAPISEISLDRAGAFDSLDQTIEDEMDDEEFRRLVETGVVIPLSPRGD